MEVGCCIAAESWMLLNESIVKNSGWRRRINSCSCWMLEDSEIQICTS
jgi:hypothetical protein